VRDCDHVGHRVYTKRVFANGTTHHCVQCLRCLRVVKMPEHDMRPFIRRDEIPAGIMPRPFIEPEELV